MDIRFNTLLDYSPIHDSNDEYIYYQNQQYSQDNFDKNFTKIQLVQIYEQNELVLKSIKIKKDTSSLEL